MTLEAEPFALSEAESLYLCRGGVGRIATVSRDGQPHAVPVVFEFDGRYVYFSGRMLAKSLKLRNLESNPKVAFVVDDLVSVSPWRPRGVELRGFAEVFRERGLPYVRITPLTAASWGL
jgi:pyridoxamine 5'-phosphate oxidase family protein